MWEYGNKNMIVIPAVRMTQRTKFSKRAKRYLAFKGELAEEMRTKGRGRVPKKLKLSFEVRYMDRRRRDIDNILKAILDALVESGIVDDDAVKIIPELGQCQVKIGAKENSVYIRLEKVGNEPLWETKSENRRKIQKGGKRR